MSVHVTEIVPGEYDVTPDGARRAVRVLVPAGVGVPGIDEEALAAAVVEELVARGRSLPATLDVSELLHAAPDLVAAAARRVEDDDEH
jgi:hypothetical protein